MPSRPLPRITNPGIILCEGSHDRAFLSHLLRQRGLLGYHICSNYGIANQAGNSAFGRSLDAITAVPGFEILKGIVIVSDCDDSPENAFSSIVDQISRTAPFGDDDSRFPTPTRPLEIAKLGINLSIYLLPRINSPGNLEILLVEAARHSASHPLVCVEQLCSCANTNLWSINQLSKMMLRALICSSLRDEPDRSPARLWDEPSSANLIPIASPIFDPLTVFLRHFLKEIL